MAAGPRYITPYAYAYNPKGVPIPGALLNFYVHSSSTRAATYSDVGLTIPNTNPVVADATGTFPDIFLNPAVVYKVVLTYPPQGANPAVVIWTADPVSGGSSIPGATLLIGPFATAGGSAIPPDVTTVQTPSWAANTPGLGGATYSYNPTINSAYVAANPRTSFLSSDGRGWGLNTENGVDVCQCGARGDGTTDDAAAFQAAHDVFSVATSSSGGLIKVPGSAAGYYLGSTWKISKTVTIYGTNAGDQVRYSTASLFFPADTDGIRFYSDVDTPTGNTGAFYAQIHNIHVEARAKNVSGNGIWSTTTIKIYNCVARSFQGNGIWIEGRTGSSATGIADFSRVQDCRAVSNGGDGIRLSGPVGIQGNDVNVCQVVSCESSSNGGYGYYDNPAYCNVYMSCGAAGNTTGPFYSQGSGIGLGSLFFGCYTELTGNFHCAFDTSVTCFGGVMYPDGANNIGPTLTSFGLALTCPNTRFMFLNGSTSPNELCRIEPNGTGVGGALRNLTEIGAKNATDSMITTAGLITITRSGTASTDIQRFNNANGRVGSINISGTTTTYATSSDIDLKDDVVDLDREEAVRKIMSISPRSWKWKVDGAYGEGFVAHELQEVFPIAVAGERGATEMVPLFEEDENGSIVQVGEEEVPLYQGVDASHLIAALIATVQTQQHRLDTLEAKAA